ncbi:MAG: hypothetical protein Q9209_001538 [Squamulea sp. 1 TL-2023]
MAKQQGLEQAKASFPPRFHQRQNLSLLLDIYQVCQRPIEHLVLGECQYVRNDQAKTHKAIKCRDYRKLTVFSGTIIANKWYESEDHAQEAVSDIQSLFIELESLGMSLEEVKNVAKGVQTAQVAVEYRLLRPFLVEIIRGFREKPRTLFLIDQVGPIMVQKAIDHVRLKFGISNVTATSQPRTAWRVLFELN